MRPASDSHVDPQQTPSRQTWRERAADVILASLLGWSMAGAWVAWLTLRLNPHLHSSNTDRLVLLLFIEVFFLLIGLTVGVTVAVTEMILPGRPGWRHSLAKITALLSGLIYATLLPGTGVGGTLLIDILAPHRRDAMMLHLGFLGIGVLLVAGALTFCVALAGRVGLAFSRKQLRWIVLVVGALALTAPVIWPLPGMSEDQETFEAGQLPLEPLNPDPDPVVVLCVDGADLDDVVLPMVQEGQLPTFKTLVSDGISGPLETLKPSLSPVVWTTLATGALPEKHGIEHFLYTQLPGMSQPILHFPLATGFNFFLVKMAERIPAVPPLRHAYTSGMRRRRALWGIASEYVTVGVYRWLITWPAEPVNGFNIAEGVVVDLDQAGKKTNNLSGRSNRHYPPDVNDRIGKVSVPKPSLEDAAEFLGTRVELIENQRQIGAVKKAMLDPTDKRLARLREAFSPVLMLANFYSVDGFNHLFGRHWLSGTGPFAGALPARYRQLDDKLAELIASFERPTNLIIVSDHGYDFEADHHANAPAGLFIAMGPAFRRGATADDLSVVDIAPLVLRLLNLPVAEDLPGTLRGTYERVLAVDFRNRFPEQKIPTWEKPGAELLRIDSVEDDKKTIEQLKALGYIE